MSSFDHSFTLRWLNQPWFSFTVYDPFIIYNRVVIRAGVGVLSAHYYSLAMVAKSSLRRVTLYMHLHHICKYLKMPVRRLNLPVK